jgi:N utilization substance protein B
MGESPRRRVRELVLQALYAAEIEELDPEDVIKSILLDQDLSEKNQAFARELFLLTCKNRKWADDRIQSLAVNWDISRLADIDRNIMRMALVEIEHIPDTPVKVVINEAIELGKKYSTGESSSFINGILDSYVKGKEHSRS